MSQLLASLPSSDAFATIIMATLAMKTFFLFILNVVSFAEMFVPPTLKVEPGAPRLVSMTQSLDLAATPLPPANDDGNIAIVICGGVGSLILYYGGFLLSGRGSASLSLCVLTVFGTFMLSSLAERYPRFDKTVKQPIAFGALSFRSQTSPRPKANWNSVFDNLPWPRRSATYNILYSGSVLPAVTVAVDMTVLAIGTKVTVGLGLCATFEAIGICTTKFQQDFPMMSIRYMGLLLVALYHDLLIGVLRPTWPGNVWHFIRKLKTPYAFMVLPIFFRLHRSFMWTEVVPRLTDAINSLTLIIVGQYVSDPLLAMDSTADFIVNPPFSARSVGLFIAALSLTTVPALGGYRKRYWALSGAGIGILGLPWDAVARPITSLIILGIVFALFSYLFKSIARHSGWSVLGYTIFIQILIVFWSFLFCHSDDIRNSYSQGELEIVQVAIVAAGSVRDSIPKTGAPARLERLTLVIDISSLVFTLGSFALVDLPDSFHEEVEYASLPGHAFAVVGGNRDNGCIDAGGLSFTSSKIGHGRGGQRQARVEDNSELENQSRSVAEIGKSSNDLELNLEMLKVLRKDAETRCNEATIRVQELERELHFATSCIQDMGLELQHGLTINSELQQQNAQLQTALEESNKDKEIFFRGFRERDTQLRAAEAQAQTLEIHATELLHQTLQASTLQNQQQLLSIMKNSLGVCTLCQNGYDEARLPST
ncbi:hypothetical protein E1B28_005111 [Marasmius oreades]|uniref:Uncharacterized protein n=1 Tax=Marasmius oreades TaxID=181124 RepID=A0A9P7V033_9AGAR|nr:uncharacterized protein E1B28_005111 [Marasmius oreades]KAG7097792.1 hypothetical protein E1B28_005111 [Marasmius oreades]